MQSGSLEFVILMMVAAHHMLDKSRTSTFIPTANFYGLHREKQ